MSAGTDPLQPAHSFAQRVMRGAAFTSGGFVLSQGMRFASNLVLARLLFPEAFGLMALMTMVLTGLTMLSDTGVPQSIMQNKRGDDPDFLNTAWTLNLMRGVLLWLVACALAWPAAWLYEASELLWILPLGGLSLVMLGAAPTRVFSAQRHLQLGRIMGIELGSQLLGILAMVALAWMYQTYWALVAGVLVTGLAKLVMEWTLLSGPRNSLRWEKAAGGELLRFGGWIMLSSAFGFVLLQGDRAILGVFLTVEKLGIYNIAYFLAFFPVLMAHTMMSKLLIPSYREMFAGQNGEHDRKIRRMRMGLTGTVMALLTIMVLIGPALIDLLYDDRYAEAGPIIVMISCGQMLSLIMLTYDQSALARGDSRRFFWIVAFRATVQTGCFLAGAALAGLPGALAGQAVAAVLVYPAVAALATQTGVRDKRHDALFSALALLPIAGGLTLHWDKIAPLLP
ncbi:MAG: oligosaccharide flippase family protein [Alphaproteobacteria bacterium]|jgi:O-antigen/teichoic acid export membrane protein|nr:oligosaccharide flippase family protein [Alphaproteobacteria bacterium]